MELSAPVGSTPIFKPMSRARGRWFFCIAIPEQQAQSAIAINVCRTPVHLLLDAGFIVAHILASRHLLIPRTGIPLLVCRTSQQAHFRSSIVHLRLVRLRAQPELPVICVGDESVSG